MRRTAKTIIALAAGLAALVSCNRNPDNPPCREIVFGIRGVKVETRSLVETDLDKLKENGFRVICGTSQDEPPMFSTTVLYDETDRVFRNPSTRYYYPENGSQLSFAAVYPSTESIQMEDGNAVVHYVHNPEEDFCIAYQVGVQESAVMMNFHHKLAQISLNCASEDGTVDYRIDSIVIIAKNKARFCIDMFGDDNYWEEEDDAEETGYPIVSAPTAISTAMAPIGEPLTLIPGGCTLKVKWSIYRKGTDKLLARYSNDITGLDAPCEIHKTLNLTLPRSVKDIHFESAVLEWAERDDDISPAFEKGTFTVDRTGKKVKFAPGNLYWNGSKFAFEAHQYDFPSTWNASHVGHFNWSDDVEIAVAKNYSGTGSTVNDKFFAVDGGAIEGYTVLSREEWTYVLTQHMAVTSEPTEDNAYAFTIDGVKCIILTPDFFTGTIKDQYTAAEWAAAEKNYGLAAFPFAGNRYGSSINSAGDAGHFWSSSVCENNADYVWQVHFNPILVSTYDSSRKYAFPVRLVSVQ